MKQILILLALVTGCADAVTPVDPCVQAAELYCATEAACSDEEPNKACTDDMQYFCTAHTAACVMEMTETYDCSTYSPHAGC